jgi:hypothetical protein
MRADNAECALARPLYSHKQQMQRIEEDYQLFAVSSKLCVSSLRGILIVFPSRTKKMMSRVKDQLNKCS